MDVYQTEEQQVEAIQKFFKNNSKLILAVIVLSIVFIFGSAKFRDYRMSQKNQASDIYQAMVLSFSENDFAMVKSKADELFIDDYFRGYQTTPYPQLAALLLAKIAVTENDLEAAEQQLRKGIELAKSEDLTYHIAKVRLSRVLQATGHSTEALAELSSHPDGYVPLYEQAKGDIFVAINDSEKAKAAYLKAVAALPSGYHSEELVLKLMDLGVADIQQALRSEDV